MRLVSSVLRTTIRMSSKQSSYSHAKTDGFSQEGPVLHNPFRDDPLLERTLRRLLPQKDYDRVAADLDRFGERIVSEINYLGRQCELNPPTLKHYDAWGKRVDKLNVCAEWYRLKEICAEEGLIGIGYDTKTSPITRRIHQIAKLYLFSPSAGLTTCPMAMTDGAVKTLQALSLYGNHRSATEAVDRLISTDGKKAWTSGQWMTEKRGGSDVGGGCDTYATHIQGDTYKLNGYKWFSSAIDADVALTLARIVDDKGQFLQGSKGLSLFLLRIRDDNGLLNGIQMVRLKDKLGTKQLPTAELLLDGCVAERIGDAGRGVAGIANMLNITRIHNAVASVSAMRRILSLARDYSTRRSVFGQNQSKWPLHTATLCKMEVQTRACVMLLFESARLLGVQETGNGSLVDSVMLRMLTPVLKLFAGKMCVPLISEGIECFGGQGYIEETGLPSILRDAQVTPIWEGTTNVLSLDLLRVFAGKENVLHAFEQHISSLIDEQTENSRLQEAKFRVQEGYKELKTVLTSAQESTIREAIRLDVVARDIALSIGNLYAGALLIEAALHKSSSSADVEVAHRWCCEQKLVNVQNEWMTRERTETDKDIVFENYAGSAKSKI